MKQLQIFSIIFFSLLLLQGCTTNRIHFSDYFSDAEINSIQSHKVQYAISKIDTPSPCKKCGEGGNLVWHAANFTGRSLYEGFFSIPVSDWNKFVKTSLANQNKGVPAEVTLKRVFLKTWENPQYYAASVSLTLSSNGKSVKGSALVKIKGEGQLLLRPNAVKLDDNSLSAIKLAIKAAYIDAASKTINN